MTSHHEPFLALVDDDVHSARLMTRMLLAHGAPTIRWLETPATALGTLGALLADRTAPLPGLVIVDLKASSVATRDFLVALRRLPGAERLVVAAIMPALERQTRQSLLDSGADAVFERHAEIDAYRREAASLVSYWVRNQRLSAIGA